MRLFFYKLSCSIALSIVTQLCNAQFAVLVNFIDDTTGYNSMATLIAEGSYLYGTTKHGPSPGIGTGNGTIYRVMPDGSGYQTLHEFLAEPDGRWPVSGLYSDGTWLYGTTKEGGANFAGTVYKIKPDGSEYQIIHNFEGVYEGLWPSAALISDGTFLYGTTSHGGDYSHGTMFKLMPDGTDFEMLYEFNGAVSGKHPNGELLYDGTWLYGLTEMGGANDDGVMFRILPDGSSYEVLLELEASATGSNCLSSLLMLDGWLYGMSKSGGANDDGLLFKVLPDGSSFTVLLHFDSAVTGGVGTSTPVTDGIYLYAITSYGGANDNGAIFKIKPDGTDFLKLFDFEAYVSGYRPTAGLLLSDNYLFGSTETGGDIGDGLVFKFQLEQPNSIFESDNPHILVYPNPASDQIIIHFGNKVPKNTTLISIIDSTGKRVWQSTQVMQNMQVDVSHLPEGVYTLTVKQDNTTTHQTFIKIR
jgi:uncharacterized repeat protein (TIGR03803 family)